MKKQFTILVVESEVDFIVKGVALGALIQRVAPGVMRVNLVLIEELLNLFLVVTGERVENVLHCAK